MYCVALVPSIHERLSNVAGSLCLSTCHFGEYANVNEMEKRWGGLDKLCRWSGKNVLPNICAGCVADYE